MWLDLDVQIEAGSRFSVQLSKFQLNQSANADEDEAGNISVCES